MIETNVSGKSTEGLREAPGKAITSPRKSRRTTKRKYVDHDGTVCTRCPHHHFKDDGVKEKVNLNLNLCNTSTSALVLELLVRLGIGETPKGC